MIIFILRILMQSVSDLASDEHLIKYIGFKCQPIVLGENTLQMIVDISVQRFRVG